MNKTIIAAGAVVWRKSESGQVEVVLIHRPKYNDWSFPKGKVDIGEAVIACAHREVLEESNLETQFGPYLGDVEYETIDGPKRVYFWSAKVITAYPFTPNSEVDKLEWHSLKSANKILTLDSDREILSKFSKLDLDTKPFILLRHAKAITRDEWQGDDDDRPLDSLGSYQADRLISIYEVYKLEQIHSSDAIRCFDTVNALARKLNITLEVSGKLSESAYKKDKEKGAFSVFNNEKSDKISKSINKIGFIRGNEIYTDHFSPKTTFYLLKFLNNTFFHLTTCIDIQFAIIYQFC